jgi:hypothetical protein
MNPVKKNLRTSTFSSSVMFLIVVNNNPPATKFPNNRAEPMLEEITSIDHIEVKRAQIQRHKRIKKTGKFNHSILWRRNHKIKIPRMLPIITRGERPLGAINPRIGAKNAIKPSKYPRLRDD